MSGIEGEAAYEQERAACELEEQERYARFIGRAVVVESSDAV